MSSFRPGHWYRFYATIAIPGLDNGYFRTSQLYRYCMDKAW